MARIKPLFRVLAIINALLLLGAYVCYRGGVVQAFNAKAPERPVQGDPPPVVQAPTPPKNGGAAPAPESPPVTKTDTPHRKAIDDVSMFPRIDSTTSQQRQELLGGSKSIVMKFEASKQAAPAAPADATPQTEAEAAPRRRVIMGGSKSAKVSIDEVEVPVKPAVPAAKPANTERELTETQRQILMSGSKSETIYVEPSKTEAQPPRQEAARQQSSQSAPVKPRKIMGGSKSAPIEIDLNEKQ